MWAAQEFINLTMGKLEYFRNSYYYTKMCQTSIVEHVAQADKMLSLPERRYCNWQAGAQDGCWYNFYVKAKTNQEL